MKQKVAFKSIEFKELIESLNLIFILRPNLMQYQLSKYYIFFQVLKFKFLSFIIALHTFIVSTTISS